MPRKSLLLYGWEERLAGIRIFRGFRPDRPHSGVSVVEVLDGGFRIRWGDTTGDVDRYDGSWPTCQVVISN